MGKIALTYQAVGSGIFLAKIASSGKNKNVIEVWDEVSFFTYSLILNFPFICIFCYYILVDIVLITSHKLCQNSSFFLFTILDICMQYACVIKSV